MANRSSGKRIFELDALRGLAACVVVLHHFRYMSHMGGERWFLRPFFAGHAAVILFFSLSGYVLSLAYWHNRQLPYQQFLIRRFFRIYVPYAAACFFAVLVGTHFLYAQLPLTFWFYQTWHTALSVRLVARQLITMSITPEINTAFWSLRYEVEMSVVFPALCLFLKKLRPTGSILLGILCAFLGTSIVDHHNWYSQEAEVGRTITYASSFIFGALMAWKSHHIRAAYRHTRLAIKAILLFISLVGYFSFKDIYIIPSSCMLIIFSQNSIAKKWLNQPIPEYLGKISYSLYLTHGTVLFAAMILLYQHIPLRTIEAIYLTVAVAVAHVFNLLIEDRADQLGKRIAGKAYRGKKSGDLPAV